MYESFFHLSGKPFQLNPDPSFFFGSRGHKRAFAYLGPCPAARHRRRGPGFVEKNQPPLQLRLPLTPGFPRGGDVGPLLFAGVHGFF